MAIVTKSYGQPQAIDSLTRELKTLDENDVRRVDVLNQLAYLYSRTEIQKASNFNTQALLLANFLDYTPGIAQGLYNRGYIARKNHEYDIALEKLFQGLDLVEGNSDYIKEEARLLREIANIYGITKNYQEADRYYAAAQSANEVLGNNRDIAIIIHNRGLSNFEQRNLEKATEFALEARKYGEEQNDPLVLGLSYRLLGQIYGNQGYRQHEDAIQYLETAYKYFTEINDQQSLTEIYYELARNLVPLGRFQEATEYLRQAHNIADRLSNPLNMLAIYEIYANLEEKRGGYKEALFYQKQATALKDSIQGLTQYWRMAKRQSEYETRGKDQQIVEGEARSRRQLSVIILVSAFAVGLAVLIVIIYRVNHRRKRINAELREKNDEIESYNIELSQKNEEIEAQAEWLRQTNEQMEIQKNELTQLNRMKDRMLSVISHDFRSPLNSLRGALMLLNSQQLPPDQLQMVTDDINNKLNRTLNLVDNLLQWTRNQLMGIEVDPERLNMRALTDETIHLLSPLAEGKRIDLVNRVAEDAEVDADLEMMKVVLRNLISNAIKFTLKSGQVSIDSKREDHYLSISVSDTGIGMTPDKVDRLFELSTDRSSLGTANEKGTGIGLLLCKEFVEKHGGHIVVTSTEQKGSTFTFSLPIQVAADTAISAEIS